MLITINPSHGWQCVATFEVIGKAPSIGAVLGDIQHQYRVEPAKEAPVGYSWFDVMVDFSFGERRAWHVAYAILTALQGVADEGLIAGYRLVTGQLYLSVGSSAQRARATSPSGQQEPLAGASACA